MSVPFVDCIGLAGGYSLGATQAGFELVHRASIAGGFGDSTIRANISGDWDQDPETEWDSWTPAVAGLLCGTPPCSGFSSLTTRGARGPGAAINKCMWELINYAGRCYGTDGKKGPEIVSIESVQAAFTKGRDLMRAFWEQLEDDTGLSYELHHVLMSGSSIGAAQMRHRYFMVLSRVPFGVDPPSREDLPDQRVVTYRDALSDLEGARVQWESQPYPRDAQTEYQRLLRADSLTCHQVVGGGVASAAHEVSKRGWRPGSYLSEAFDELDYHPTKFAGSRDFGTNAMRRGKSSYRGLNWPYKILPDRPGYVLAGSCSRDFAHWSEHRMLTIRELSRLMGYPDSWEWPHKVTVAGSQLGKCAPVPSCRWMATWFMRALEGSPGASGAMIGEDEYLHNSTDVYKDWL